jgi:hypothetical protein
MTHRPTLDKTVQSNKSRTSRRPIGNLALTKESLGILGELFHTLAKYEHQIELKRQYLATNENFEPYQAFMRLDRDQSGFLGPKKLL